MEEKNQPRRPRRSPEENPQKNESLVYGKNPVTELLKSGSGVDTVLLAEGMAPAVAAYFTAMAKEAGATVKRVHPNKLRLMTGTESHQGVAAFASEIEYATVEDLLAAAKAKGEPPFLVLSDGIEDPHNLGAVMRSALLCGAHGIVIPNGTYPPNIHRPRSGDQTMEYAPHVQRYWFCRICGLLTHGCVLFTPTAFCGQNRGAVMGLQPWVERMCNPRNG